MRVYPNVSSVSYDDESPDGPSPPLSTFPALANVDVNVAVSATNAMKEVLDNLQERFDAI